MTFVESAQTRRVVPKWLNLCRTGNLWTHVIGATGGRYCCTSTFPATTKRVCCVTALGFDHVSILGSSIEQIAAAKAGIFRADSVLVASRQKLSAAAAVLQSEAAQFPSSKFFVSDPAAIPKTVELGLKGECQRENAATAILAVRQFEGRPTDDQLDGDELTALAATFWPGRSQHVQHTTPGGKQIQVYIDAAHTKESIDECVSWLGSMSVRDLPVVFNLTGDRDPAPLLLSLSTLSPSHLFLTPNQSTDVILKDQENRNFPIQKQLDKLELIAAIASKMRIPCSIHTSMENVLKSLPDQTSRLLITGSVHLVGSYFALRPDLPV